MLLLLDFFSLVCFVMEHFVLLFVLCSYFERERDKELKAGLLGREEGSGDICGGRNENIKYDTNLNEKENILQSNYSLKWNY